MDSDELTDWMIFYDHEPWGYLAEEHRAGLIASTVINCTPRGRGAKMFRREEWSPDRWKGEVSEFTPEQRAFIAKRKKQRKQGGNSRNSPD